MSDVETQQLSCFDMVPEFILIRILSFLSVPEMLDFSLKCTLARRLIFETSSLQRRIKFSIVPWAFSDSTRGERGSVCKSLRKVVGPYRQLKLDCPGEVHLRIITCLMRRLAPGLRVFHYFGNRIAYFP